MSSSISPCRTTRDAWCDLEISGATAPRCWSGCASFAEAGARLVLIGQATPPHAAHFRCTQGIDLPVLADAERLTYKAAGAKVATMDELLPTYSPSASIDAHSS